MSSKMTVVSYFQGAFGGVDSLCLQRGKDGGLRIIYDDGARRHMVWRVTPGAQDRALRDALRRAADQSRVLPALYAELRRRSIAVEAVSA